MENTHQKFLFKNWSQGYCAQTPATTPLRLLTILSSSPLTLLITTLKFIYWHYNPCLKYTNPWPTNPEFQLIPFPNPTYLPFNLVAFQFLKGFATFWEFSFCRQKKGADYEYHSLFAENVNMHTYHYHEKFKHCLLQK